MSFFSITVLRMFWCTSICVCFATPMTPPKHGFLKFQQHRCPRNCFLICCNKKKSLGAKSELYVGWPFNSTFWPVQKSLDWADVWELALSWCMMIRLLLFVFRISPKTLGKHIVVYHSELIVLRCSTLATWPEDLHGFRLWASYGHDSIH